MSKLKSMKASLKTWNIEIFGEFRLEKGRLMGRLETIDRLENTPNGQLN